MAKKHTHVAVHTVLDGKTSIQAGTHFTPDADTLEFLTKAGAVRELNADDIEAGTDKGQPGTQDTPQDRDSAPAGYAAGTEATRATDAQRERQNAVIEAQAEPRVASSSSAEASAKAPASRSTPGAKR